MAVNLLDFLYDTNDEFVTKVQTLMKRWRVGIPAKSDELDLVIYSMYAKLLGTDLTDYGYSYDNIMPIVNGIVNIFNISNIIINEGDVINYITNNTTNIVYNETIVYEAPFYSGTYSGTGEFTVTVTHNLNKTNPTVIVTDTATGSRIRVEVGITETDVNTLVLSFSSTSSGDYKIM